MATEIELKCTTSLPGLDQARKLFMALQVLDSKQVTLVNRYYDTPDFQLNRHQVALRVRKNNDQFIQTLKTKGESTGGLHQRGEWEWLVPTDSLDLNLLQDASWPADIDANLLKPAFATNFDRTQITLEFNQSEIEVAIDQGEVSSSGQMMPLYEVEFELKRGKVADLFAIARFMAETIPFQVSDVSKGERGYFLGGVLSLRSAAELLSLANQSTADAIISNCIESWVAALDATYLTGDVEYLATAIGVIDRLLVSIVENAADFGFHNPQLADWLTKERDRLDKVASRTRERFDQDIAQGSQEAANALIFLMEYVTEES